MNIINISYSNESKNLLRGSYFNRVYISLKDLDENDKIRIHKAVKSKIYSFGIIGFHNLNNDILSNHGIIEEHSYLGIRNKEKLIIGNLVASLVVYGPNAEDIKQEIINLMPEENLLNLEDKINFDE